MTETTATETAPVYVPGPGMARALIQGETKNVIVMEASKTKGFWKCTDMLGKSWEVKAENLSAPGKSLLNAINGKTPGEAVKELNKKRFALLKKYPHLLDHRDVPRKGVKEGSLEGIEAKIKDGSYTPVIHVQSVESGGKSNRKENVYMLDKAMNVPEFKEAFEKLLKKHKYDMQIVTRTRKPRKKKVVAATTAATTPGTTESATPAVSA